jgi:site-specific recombinase XerD
VKGNDRITEKLSGGQIGRIFKHLAKVSGLNTELTQNISGHSFRVGAAQDLLISGASLPQIMAKGGWTKVETVMRYVEKIYFP